LAQYEEERLIFDDLDVMARIFGRHDENAVLLEKHLGVRLVARGDGLLILGPAHQVERAREILRQMEALYRTGRELTPQEVGYLLQAVREGNGRPVAELLEDAFVLVTVRGKQVRPKTLGQREYVEAMKRHDIVFAVGPAGTGKTYLAVAMAVRALRKREVARLILTRPAVEAGEKLGFLPGDLQEKVNPYLRPLYDSLYDILGFDQTQKYMDKHIIEIAPLAYMRGRTLEDAFVILDEAQNTTPEQMKMFLTRLGFSSRAVITGDVTQIDLPKGQTSGLVDARQVLAHIKGIAFVDLTESDIVRHPLVQEIVRAYEERARQE
jgi:phosphate starvation-inducible PhoH-like protein